MVPWKILVKRAIGSGCEVEKHALVAHLLQLLLGNLVAVLDGIGARIDRSLNAGLVNSVYGNFQARTMCLLDDRGQFANREIDVSRDLDHIHTLKLVLPDCLPCAIRPID